MLGRKAEPSLQAISQTIVRIQSSDAKREMFPGCSVRNLDRFDAPGLEEYCLDGRANRLYKPFSVRHLDRFDAPGLEKSCLDGRANRLYKPLYRRQVVVLNRPCRELLSLLV